MHTPKIATGFRKTLIAASVALAGATAFVATVPAIAGVHRGGPMMEQIQQLNLSDSQRSEIRKILMSSRSTLKGEREHFHDRAIAFAELDPDGAQYGDKVQAMADEAAAKASELAPKLLELQGQIRAVLTPEQRTQLVDQVKNADIDSRMAMHSGPMMPMLEELNLSDEQWLSLRHIQQAQRDGHAGERAAMQAELARFAALDPDSAGYAKASAELTERFVQGARQRVMDAAEIQRQVYAVLTPEQRSTLVSELKDFNPREFHKEMRKQQDAAKS